MKIGIIGAGNVGASLAVAAITAGHEVAVSASQPDSAREAAASAGARAATSNGDAVQQAEVVVLAVPHGAVAGLVAELGDALSGKVVIDATNPLNDSYSDLTTSGVSAAEQLQQQVPSASVVKALNTVFASATRTPRRRGSRWTRSSPATTLPPRARSPRWSSRSASVRSTSAACGWLARSKSSRS